MDAHPLLQRPASPGTHPWNSGSDTAGRFMQLHKHILLHNWGTWGLSVWEQAGCTYIRLFARCPSPILSEDWRAGQDRSVDWGYRQESAKTGFILAWVSNWV